MRKLAFTTHPFDAAEARAVRLVDRVFTDALQSQDGVLQAVAPASTQIAADRVARHQTGVEHGLDRGVTDGLECVATWSVAACYQTAPVKPSRRHYKSDRRNSEISERSVRPGLSLSS